MIGSAQQRRVAISLVDQLVSSVSNFAVGLAVARFAGPADFGQYMLVFTIWLVVVGIHRALVTDAMIITSSESDDRRSLLAKGVSAELLFGTVVSVVVAGGGLVAHLADLRVGVLMLAMAPWFVPLLLQDFWRAMAFQQRRPGLALANDVTFAVVQFAAIAAFWVVGWRTAGHIIAAWGIGATAGSLLGFRGLPATGRLIDGGTLLARLWPLSRWMLADYLTGFASHQAYIALVTLLVSPVDYGGFRAALNLMGPSVVIVHAGANVGLPEASRRFAEGPASLERFARRMTAVTFSCIAIYGVVVVLTGKQLMSALYGPEFGPFAPLATLTALQHLIMVTVFGQATAMKAAGRMRSLWLGRVLVAVASLISTVILVRSLGTIGAAWAGVATGCYYAVAVYVSYRRKDQRPTAAGQDSSEGLPVAGLAQLPSVAPPTEIGP